MLVLRSLIGSRYSLVSLTLAAACLAGCGDDASNDPDDTSTGEDPLAVTYWQDVAPIYYERCVGCHQPGAAGPFSLADYASAKTYALPAKAATQARTMPPWLVTADGSCGSFRDSMALTDDEIATIAAWADQGAPEGTPVELSLPPTPTLPDAVDYTTPNFVPEIVGGEHALFDEYRCFAIDPGLTTDRFVTGHEVIPGNPALVHHALLFSLEPDAPAAGGKTNAEVIAELDAQSPDRDGWPCFGTTGDGTEPDAAPVTWAPGQGPLNYPEGTGARVTAGSLLIVQMHYNMSDPALIGQSDSTTVRLRWADQVEREGFFVFPDPLLESAFGPDPDTLPPGEPSYPYTWQASPAELGLSGVPAVDVYGIFPHMHELGRKFNMSVVRDGGSECAADVQSWDFNWQRMYFYEQPIRVSAHEPIRVVCDYDTTGRSEPVYPGWGTQNEMCLALMFLVPAL